MGIYYNQWDIAEQPVQLENYVAIPCLIGYIVFTLLTLKHKQDGAAQINNFHTQKSINFGTRILRAIMVLLVLGSYLIFNKYRK